MDSDIASQQNILPQEQVQGLGRSKMRLLLIFLSFAALLLGFFAWGKILGKTSPVVKKEPISTYIVAEPTINPALPSVPIPFGTMYYTAFLRDEEGILIYDNPKLFSLDAMGNKKSILIPEYCHSIRISWDQQLLFCSTETDFWIINLRTSESRNIRIDQSLIGAYPSSEYSWSVDKKSLLFSSGFTTGSRALFDVYRLNTQSMMIEKIPQEVLPGAINKAIYSADSHAIAIERSLGTEGNRLGSMIHVTDIQTNTTKEIMPREDCQADCYVTYLQFSNDSKNLLVGTETFVRKPPPLQGTYVNTFTLYDLATGITKKVTIKTAFSTFSGTDAIVHYDGTDSLVFFGPAHSETETLQKINLRDGTEALLPTAKDIRRPGSYLAFQGDWIVYRTHEEETFVTYIEKIGGERFRVLNNNEFVLAAEDSHPVFVYWFR